ncbi:MULTISPECIES: anti-repressor SinI family protein [Virgibacillus]|uniref:Antagonist of SinR n=1 Tax=Virgibacillus salinus TaxID=553311 RepID=A0A1H0ZBM5_9BACI|nr:MULTISPECIES: anti-repressor SinI family protein [Virgibacillus]SDQ24772.1 antagonist of SinR [Virgibacillus salinus]
MINVKKNREIDYEWLELMKEAKTIGLTLEEVRLFLAGIKQNE